MELHLTYGVSLAIWDHTVLHATWHMWTHPALTIARQNSIRFTYPRGMEGWVDLGDWLHTDMVYLPADGHPSNTNLAAHSRESNSQPGSLHVWRSNYYTTTHLF